MPVFACNHAGGGNPAAAHADRGCFPHCEVSTHARPKPAFPQAASEVVQRIVLPSAKQ
jgi:hypothetical protein